MSDLSMYEFEDIAWDEFCMTDDHTVPHPSVQQTNEHSLWPDDLRKPCHELVGVQNFARDKSSGKAVCQEKQPDKLTSVNNRRKRMLDKDHLLQTASGVFPSCNNDSGKEDASSPGDAPRRLSHCFKNNTMDSIASNYCVSDAIPADKTTEVESNSCNYQLAQEENEMTFFGGTDDTKDCGDLMYYDWPDISNFEEVDKIFRNCDATFGLGANEEDEFRWFASSDSVEASGDESKPGLKFSCSESSTMENESKNYESLRRDESSPLGDICLKNAPDNDEDSPCILEKDKKEGVGHFSFVNGVCNSETNDGILTQQGGKSFRDVCLEIQDAAHSTNCSSEMMNVPKAQQKHGAQSDGIRKDQYLTNVGLSFAKGRPDETLKGVPKGASTEVFSCMGIPEEKPLGQESYGFLPSNIQYMHSDYSCPSDLTSGCKNLSAVKSDNSSLSSVSPKESYSSNQVFSGESCQGLPHQNTFIAPKEELEKLHQTDALQSSFSRKPDNMDMVAQVPLCSPISLQRKVQHPENNFCGGEEEVLTELGSTTLQGSTSVSSTLDEISFEAASFRQLQLVMEQLDLRTKLCIRDSLYRLARSAEQRHNNSNLHVGCAPDDQDTGRVPISEGANKCIGLMDMETDTNPIDRSIAHLLFHRPSAPTTIPTQESSFNSGAAAMAPDFMKSHNTDPWLYLESMCGF